VRVRHVGMVPGPVVVTVLIMPGGLAMMLRGFLVMFRRGLVMGAAFVRLRHVVLLVIRFEHCAPSRAPDRRGDDAVIR